MKHAAIILTGVCLIAAISNADLVSFYEFEGNYENSGTGTAVGQPLGDAEIVIDAMRGSVLAVDGDGDYVRIDNDDVEGIDSVMTVAAWVKSSQNNWSAHDSIVSRGYNWRLFVTGSKDGTFQCMDTVPAGSKVRGSVDINDEQWHHLAGVYDGTQYIFYVDGVQDGPAVAATGVISLTTSHKFTIGAFESSEEVKRWYGGYIDDVRVYDHVLSASEIKDIVFPKHAYLPQPANGAIEGTNLQQLSWLRPQPRYPDETEPILCDVWFGADPNVASPTFSFDKIESRLDADVTENLTPTPLANDTTYYWKVDCYDPNNGVEIFTQGPLWSFTTGNVAPVVFAGDDKVARLSETTITIELDDATVEDDGLPTGSTLTQLWTVVSSPEGSTVVFDPDNDGNPEQSTAVNPTVTIDTTGTYVLRLTADDEDLTRYDQLTIHAPSCESTKQAGFQMPGDLDGDCDVDLADLAALALDWATCNDPQNLTCDKPFI
jgi:hypothetical protein